MGFIKKMFDHFKQTATETNKITREDDTLQIGDIVLLYWIDTNNGDFFPSYFEQEYKINPQLHRNKLIRLGLLTFQKSEKSLSKLKVAELKEILKAKSLPVSGKKYDLIQRIMNNFDLLEDSIPSSICTTNTGQQILITKILLEHTKIHIYRQLNIWNTLKMTLTFHMTLLKLKF